MMFDYCKSHILHSKSPATNSSTRRQTCNTAPLPDTRTNTTSTDRKAGLTPIQSLFSGMIAGTTSVFFTYPLDLARAQLAVLRKQKRPKMGDGLTVSSGGVKKKGLGYVLGNSFKQGVRLFCPYLLFFESRQQFAQQFRDLTYCVAAFRVYEGCIEESRQHSWVYYHTQGLHLQ
jgi:hypothetical protein